MNDLSEIINQMEDVILPPAIGWWPLASSVWITLVSVLGVLIGLIWYFRQRHKAALYRRVALSELQRIDGLQQHAFLIELNALLKQVAITAYGRQACAGLDHQAWLDFLQKKAGFIEQPPALQRLTERYANRDLSAQERQALLLYTKRWIEGHHQ